MRQNLRDVKIKIIHFTNYIDKKTALLHRFNAGIRVLDDSQEVFFSELNNAIQYLLKKGYHIDIDI